MLLSELLPTDVLAKEFDGLPDAAAFSMESPERLGSAPDDE
jgi:hypothetical protein